MDILPPLNLILLLSHEELYHLTREIPDRPILEKIVVCGKHV
jgi:hypothetical protein